jgi:hypothetical protein
MPRPRKHNSSAPERQAGETHTRVMSDIDRSSFPFLDAGLMVCDILAECGRVEIDSTPLLRVAR